MTLEERIEKLNQKFGNLNTNVTQQNNTKDKIETKEGVIRAAGQGLSFGFGDEIEALYKSKKNKTSYEDELANVRGKIKQFKEDSPVAAYGTEIAASIPSMVAGGAGLARLGIKGAGKIGAIESGTYGAGIGENAEERATGAVVGGALGGTTTKLAQKVFPKTTELAKKFLRNDIRLTGPQSVKGSGVLGELAYGIESSSTSIPGVGKSIVEAKTRALSDFNKFAMLEALEPILTKGQRKIIKKQLAQVTDGNEAYSIVDKFLQDSYGEVVQKIKLTGNQITELDDNIINILLKSDLTEPQRLVVLRSLNNLYFKKQKINPATGEKFLSGKDLKNLESELYSLQTKYFKKGEVEDMFFGRTFQDIRDAFKGIASKTSEGKQLQKVNSAFARVVPIREAVTMANKTQGIFSSAQFLNALKKTDTTRNKVMTARGQNDMLKVAQEGDEIFGQFVPDSGTASRLIAGASAVNPALIARLVAPSFLASALYGGGRAASRGILNLPSNLARALPATSGLLSQPVANQGQELLNRRGLLR
tara:strand:- start:950 stop:2551 length:1602 start_codon:yes stop_codon:yes gene_type:complete